MLVAYILTKQRFLRLKILKMKDTGIFRHGNFEYVIDRKRIYQKKFLGWKLFFWSMYLEGNPNPIEFDDKTFHIVQADVPIDEIAILLKRLRKVFYEVIIIILVLINLLVSGFIYGKISGVIQ